MTNTMPYEAVCTEGDFKGRWSSYAARTDEVGRHRLKTGHTVEMNETPADKSTRGPRDVDS